MIVVHDNELQASYLINQAKAELAGLSERPFQFVGMNVWAEKLLDSELNKKSWAEVMKFISK